MNKLIKTFSAAALVSALSIPAVAATDGSLGATSSGSTDVSLTIQDRVQISGMTNVALGSYTGTGDLTGSTDYCAYRNGGGNYTVKLTSSTGSFAVANGGDSIAFAVRADVAGDGDASDGELLSYNSVSSSMAGDAAVDCSSSTNGQLHFTLAEAALQAAPSKTYTATVTVLVEPI